MIIKYLLVGGVIAVLNELFVQKRTQSMVADLTKETSEEDHNSYVQTIEQHGNDTGLMLVRLVSNALAWPLSLIGTSIVIFFHTIHKRKK